MSLFFFLIGSFTLGFNEFRPFGLGISIPDASFFLALIFLIIEGSLTKRPLKEFLPFHPLWIPSFLILLGGLISSFSAVNSNSSIAITVKQFYTFSIWISTIMVMVRRGHIGKIISSILLGATASSIISILDYSMGSKIALFFISDPSSITSIYYRFGGTLKAPNEMGMFLAVVIPLIIDRLLDYFRDKAENILKLIFYLFSLFCTLAALLITGSVSGYMGTAISAVIIISAYLINRRNTYNFGTGIKLVSISVFSIIFLYFMVYPFFNTLGIISRIQNRQDFNRVLDVTGPIRISLINEALNYIIQNPFQGAGMDQGGTGSTPESKMVLSYYVHNTIIQSWVSGGFLTFLGTFILYWQVLKYSIKEILAFFRGWFNPYSLGLSASIIGWFLMDMAQPNIYQRFKWLTAALLIGLVSIINKSVINNPFRNAQR